MRSICKFQVRSEFQELVLACRYYRHAGAPLAKILEMGDWKKQPFLAYLDEDRIEADTVLEVQIANT